MKQYLSLWLGKINKCYDKKIMDQKRQITKQRKRSQWKKRNTLTLREKKRWRERGKTKVNTSQTMANQIIVNFVFKVKKKKN